MRHRLLCILITAMPAFVLAFDMNTEMQRYINSAQVTEDGIPSGDYGPMPSPFRAYLHENWRDILDNIDAIAPTRPQQSVIFATAAFLPPQEYLEFIVATLERFESGNIDAEAVRNRVLFPPAHRYGFLQFNYKNPKVRAVCQRAKRLFPKDQQLQGYLEEILSGAGKEKAKDWLSQNQKAPPEVLPIQTESDSLTPVVPAAETPSLPTATSMSLTTSATPIVAESATTSVERKLLVWSCLVGIAAIVLFVVFLARRRG